MQQMDQDETAERSRTYGGYEGEQREGERSTRSTGQKLESDDEQYATLLARRIKQELKDELEQGRNTGMKERMTLAISSVWAAATIFGLLALALMIGVQGNTVYVLSGGVFLTCAAIGWVN